MFLDITLLSLFCLLDSCVLFSVSLGNATRIICSLEVRTEGYIPYLAQLIYEKRILILEIKVVCSLQNAYLQSLFLVLRFRGVFVKVSFVTRSKRLKEELDLPVVCSSKILSSL